MADETPKVQDGGTGSYRPVEKVKAGTVVQGNIPNEAGQISATAVPVLVQPTQVHRPWRTTARAIFQGTVAAAAMWGIIVQAAGLPDWAWVGTTVAVAGAITRVMAVPGVEVWLRTWVPWLAAAPKP